MIGQAVILCGGLGTRLGALTARLPKPLLDVAGGPFLDVLLSELGRQSARRIILLAGFGADQIRNYAAATPIVSRFGLEIAVEVESKPAGTGGATWHARDCLEETFLLLNGDSWFDIDLSMLSSLLTENSGAVGAIALRQLKDASRYGAVTLSGNQVISFAERPAAEGSGLISGGVYAFRRTLISHLPETGSLENAVFPRLAAGGRLLGKAFDGYFIDIGIPEDLARARRELSALRLRTDES